jgi:hypothetical protein
VPSSIDTISAARIRQDAERATGLADYGDFDVLGPLGLLCASLNEEAGLNAFGRDFAHDRLVIALGSRLRVVEDRKRYPEIAEQKIERPIVMTGLPRSGTTMLFNLLAQDPDNRAPMAWEVMLPSPPPERASFATDPRIAVVQARLDAWGLTSPEIFAIHPFGADLAEECPFICEQVLVNTPYAAFWNVPGYVAAVAEVGREGVLAEHRKVLQHLQARNAGKRWILKSPGHLAHLDALTAVYPDAVLVQTHRDMRKVLPSYASLFSAERRLYSDDPRNSDAGKMLRERIPYLAGRLAAAADFREHARQTVVDLLYTELAADPMGAVRELYRTLDIELTPATDARMQAWLADNRKGKHGATDYSQAAAGVSEAEIDAAFGDYMARHGVVREDGGRFTFA